MYTYNEPVVNTLITTLALVKHSSDSYERTLSVVIKIPSYHNSATPRNRSALNDYSLSNETTEFRILSFPPSLNRTVCSFYLYPDEIVEDEEVFSLQSYSNENYFDSSFTTIHILDNDGKHVIDVV